MAKSAAPAPSSSARSSSGGFIWLIVGIALLALFLSRSHQRAVEAEPSLLGRPLPPLNVAGWLNAAAPPRQDALRGKVVLVDCWASWCGPCRAKMPHVVDFYQKFGNQGLVLIGLTPESGDEVKNVTTYIASVPGLTWPIGYGADMSIDMLGVDAFPTLILFDKSGKSVWASHGLAGLEDAVTDALAAE